MTRSSKIAVWTSFALTTVLVWLASTASHVRLQPEPSVIAGLRELVDHQRPHVPSAYEQAVLAAATANGLDPLLVLAIIEVESGHRPGLVSPRGAVGLMQLQPEVAAWIGVEDITEPATNIEAGCRFLAWLLEGFGGDVQLALAAYNAGPGAVRRWGTLPPYRETRQYVLRVARAYERLAGRPLPATYPRNQGSVVF